jgi:hypothetical protein
MYKLVKLHRCTDWTDSTAKLHIIMYKLVRMHRCTGWYNVRQHRYTSSGQNAQMYKLVRLAAQTHSHAGQTAQMYKLVRQQRIYRLVICTGCTDGTGVQAGPTEKMYRKIRLAALNSLFTGAIRLIMFGSSRLKF